jgi:hypothetical protein
VREFLPLMAAGLSQAAAALRRRERRLRESRQVRGVLAVGDRPGVFAISVRRYACQQCLAIMTVVPAGMLARRQYSGPTTA